MVESIGPVAERELERRMEKLGNVALFRQRAAALEAEAQRASAPPLSAGGARA